MSGWTQKKARSDFYSGDNARFVYPIASNPKRRRFCAVNVQTGGRKLFPTRHAAHVWLGLTMPAAPTNEGDR